MNGYREKKSWRVEWLQMIGRDIDGQKEEWLER
jgi:hypothetical protein